MKSKTTKINHVTVSSAPLLKAVRIATKFVATRTSLDIIKNIHMVVDGSSLTLKSTNLDNTVSVRVAAKGGSRFVGAVMPSKLLNAIKRTEENGSVEIEFGKEIAFGKKGQITLTSAPKLHEFEPIDGDNIGTGEARNVRSLIDAILPYASTDGARFVLNGIYVKPSELIATDGRRLAVAKNSNKIGCLKLRSKNHDGLLLSAKSCELMCECGNDLALDVIKTKNVVMWVHALSKDKDCPVVNAWFRVVDGTYPNYKQVIPNEIKQVVSVECKRFLSALGTADVISTDALNEAVDLSVEKNRIVVKSLAPDIGHIDNVEIPIVNGKDMRIRLCSTYLRDAINAANDTEIKLSLKDEMSPVILEPGNGWMRSVIMPIRIT